MKLYLVRHGESEINRQSKEQGKLHQGQLDSPLSEEGLHQATLVGNRLRDASFSLIYTSDLQRAAQTAHAIKTHHPVTQLIEDARLRERSKGSFEGKPKATHREEELAGDHLTRKPPGGESYLEQKHRVEAVLEEILEQEVDTLIVAHSHVIKILLRKIFSLPEEDVFKEGVEIGNTGIFIFDLNEHGIETLLYNCTHHLENEEEYY